MAGGAVGTIVHQVAPFPTGDPGAYALVGMGTLFAGIIRAPMTSVFMIFEITQDYQILVPLMVANMLSFVISKRFQRVPVYHALLQQDDVHLPLPTAQPSPATTARHLMRPDVVFLPPDRSVEDAWRVAREHHAPAYLVGTSDRLIGSVTREHLAEAVESGKAAQPVTSLVNASPVHAHPDHSVDVVLDRFAQSPGLLPVVSRTGARRVEGVVTLDSIVEFVRQRSDLAVPAEVEAHDHDAAPTAAESLPQPTAGQTR